MQSALCSFLAAIKENVISENTNLATLSLLLSSEFVNVSKNTVGVAHFTKIAVSTLGGE